MSNGPVVEKIEGRPIFLMSALKRAESKQELL